MCKPPYPCPVRTPLLVLSCLVGHASKARRSRCLQIPDTSPSFSRFDPVRRAASRARRSSPSVFFVRWCARKEPQGSLPVFFLLFDASRPSKPPSASLLLLTHEQQSRSPSAPSFVLSFDRIHASSRASSPFVQSRAQPKPHHLLPFSALSAADNTSKAEPSFFVSVRPQCTQTNRTAKPFDPCVRPIHASRSLNCSFDRTSMASRTQGRPDHTPFTPSLVRLYTENNRAEPSFPPLSAVRYTPDREVESFLCFQPNQTAAFPSSPNQTLLQGYPLCRTSLHCYC